jgi:hypothetical protein
MEIVKDQPIDLKALAGEILQPLLDWLDSISCTPARFCEVMKEDSSFFEDKPQALGISQEEFFNGINNIRSLHLYATIMGMSKEQLWMKFEANSCIAPQWLISELENAIGKDFPSSCGEYTQT